MRTTIVSLLFAVVTLVAFEPTTYAEPVPLDLAITGSMEYTRGEFYFGDWMERTIMSFGVGSAYRATRASRGAILYGSNPLAGSFTETGEELGFRGFGWGYVSGVLAFEIDLLIVLENTSPSATYRVVFGFDYIHSVGAEVTFGGPIVGRPPWDWATVSSELSLESPPGMGLHFSDLRADIREGLWKNGNPLGGGGYGGSLSDSGEHSIALDIAPGSMAQITGSWRVQGNFMEDTASIFPDYNMSASMALDGVDLIHVIPEPTTLALFGLGLAGLVAWRRKRKAA